MGATSGYPRPRRRPARHGRPGHQHRSRGGRHQDGRRPGRVRHGVDGRRDGRPAGDARRAARLAGRDVRRPAHRGRRARHHRAEDDTARLTVEVDLPAVVSVTDQSGEARVPVDEGHPRREEEAGADLGPGRPRPRPRRRRPGRGLDPGGRGGLRARPGVPVGSSPTPTVRGPPRSSSSSPPAATSDLDDLPEGARMPTVLVLATLAEGAPTRSSLEVLTLARRVGDPVAVVLECGASRPPRRPWSTTAPSRVLTVSDPAFDDVPGRPEVGGADPGRRRRAPGPGAADVGGRGQGDRRSARGPARRGAGDRRRRPRRRRHDHPVRVRGWLDRPRPRAARRAGGDPEAERGDARAGRHARRRRSSRSP